MSNDEKAAKRREAAEKNVLRQVMSKIREELFGWAAERLEVRVVGQELVVLTAGDAGTRYEHRLDMENPRAEWISAEAA